MRRSYWPNLLTSARIVLMPVVAGAAFMGWRQWFVGLLGVALLTDILDGYFARRLDAHSEFGRKLDSVADYLTLVTGLAGLALLWPEVVRREWIWFVAVMGSFCTAMTFCFLWLGRAPCYHTWASKVTVAACVVCLIPLFAGWSARPAHVVAVFQVLVGVEEMVIAILVPQHVGEMPSAWHAWRWRHHRKIATEMAGS
jgi:phosphatidylglycerophosphate synthase